MRTNWTESNPWVPKSSSAVSKFNLSLSPVTIGQQIADLLNQNNRLANLHTANSILQNNIQYFIELHCNVVIGCIGLKRQQNMDKIVHLSVHQNYRNYGIGRRLLRTAVTNSLKDTIYMQIRNDNVASLRLAESEGFNAIAFIPKGNYQLYSMILFRRTECQRKDLHGQHMLL